MKKSLKHTEKTPSGILAVRRIPDDSVRELGMTFLFNLSAAFPGRAISPEVWDHDVWDEPANFLARYLAYPSTDEFLEACGFHIVDDLDLEEEEPCLPDMPYSLERKSFKEKIDSIFRRIRQECRKRPILIPMAMLAAILLLSGILLEIFVIAGRAVVSSIG